MNNISQISIFDYTEIENLGDLGDLERLKMFFDNIQDNELCQTLEKERKNRRNDYPVRTMLNLIYAMKIFGHRSIEAFRRKEWHYGYRAHIICDAKYGLPIKSKVTPASNSEQKELDNMIEEMATGEEKYKLEKMENLMGDAGYDKENQALRYGRYTKGKKVYRVPLSTDYRIFVPVARDSKKFKTKYKMRTED